MEGTQCQLGTRLTDGLSGDDTDRLTLLYHTAGSEVAAIALRTDTLLRLTGKHGTDFNALNG